MSADSFRLQQRLQQASRVGVAPALAVAASKGLQGEVFTWYAGSLDHESGPACGPETVFDLASLTKPLTTTLWCLRLAQAGRLNLDTEIGEYLNVSSASLKRVPLWRLLSHTSGLAAHQEYFRGLGPHTLRRGTFELSRASVRRMVCSSELATTPGEAETYSDVGYLLLEMVCESVDERLATAWPKLPGHSESALHFRPVSASLDNSTVAATEQCPWRNELLRGAVHDDNCWTMGGLAGHAGLFGRLQDVHEAGQAWLSALQGEQEPLGIGSDLIRRMVDPGIMHMNGTRVLGWDTPSPGRSSAGRYFGRRSIGHLGFTGTSLWIDPDAEIVVTFLSNRVCPSRDDIRIRGLRPEVHDLVRTILGAAS